MAKPTLSQSEAFNMKPVFRLLFIVLGVVFLIKHIYLVGLVMVLIGFMMPSKI
jgi:hypothetical protein